ncbi:MAG: hypothetical protein MPN21_06275 [Thermoanaerobaculia bacterium]|nr:hypothetical protein [Thermoanaerobaculia bacterium]
MSLDSTLGMLGAYGPSEDPRARIVTTGGGRLFFLGSQGVSGLEDWRFCDLEVTGNSSFLHHNGNAPVSRDILVLRVELDGLPEGMILLRYSNGDLLSGLAVVDTEFRGMSSSSAYLLADLEDTFFAGNRMTGEPNSQQLLRLQTTRRGAIAHNRLERPGQRVLLRLTANDFVSDADVLRRVAVVDNILDGADGTYHWLVEMAGVDDFGDYRLEDVLVEGNRFRFATAASGGTSRGIRIAGRDITLRNNVFDSGTPVHGGQMIAIWKQAQMWTSQRISVLNNTAYIRPDANVQLDLVFFGEATITDSEVRNNLLYSASLSAELLTGDGTAIANTSSSNNLDASGFASGEVFAVAAPADWDDLRLGPESSALEAGTPVSVYRDEEGAPRPFDGDGDGAAAWDIGAFEFGLIFADGFESGTVSYWSSNIGAVTPRTEG